MGGQIEIMRSSDTDTVTITCQTPKSDSVDIKELREALATELLITPDEVHLTEDLDTESQVVDHRY